MPARGRPPKYPWDNWLDGRPKLLLPGRNFDPDVAVATIRKQLLAKALSRGIRVRTMAFGTGLSIEFPARFEINWDEAFNGELHAWTPGINFPEGQSWRLQEELLQQAARRGIQVVVQILDDGRVGCVKRPDPEPAATMPAPGETLGEVDTERVSS